MMKKLGLPKGMRDFSPADMAKRNFIFDTIKAAFKLHGFEQIETPSMENRSTLTGKYGEEGDRLIFNVLDSGNYLKPLYEAKIDELESNKATPIIAEKAMRYDLTVPFARYVVMHQNEITFPFKRFQIQAVWRADRPQRGRYREFYQCDADIIGSDSLYNELELIQLFDEALGNLGLKDFTIKFNNRKVLAGIAEVIGRPEKIIDITVALDKIEKIGIQKVEEELMLKGLSQEEADHIKPLYELNFNKDLLMFRLHTYLADSKIGMEGLAEVQKILDLVEAHPLKTAQIEVDVTLARGLDYYTGTIFEVVSDEYEIGSICGGGRYDNLTGVFGLENVAGVGISFGADRIYDVLENLKRFPKHLENSTQVFLINFGEKEAVYAFDAVAKLRSAGISAELYPDEAKMKKQMKYADQKNIPWVVLCGMEEIEQKLITVKNMKDGTQEQMSLDSFIEKLNK